MFVIPMTASRALILVDFENEWVTEGSPYYVGDVSELLEKTNKLIEYCRSKSYKIIFTTHIEKGSKTVFAENSKNVEIMSGLSRKVTDVLIKKNKISPFYKTTLGLELKGVKEIVICGILTNLCVRSLAQDAYDRDFKITVIKDCCIAMDKETQEFTFKDLKATREEIEFHNLKEFVG
jgi:nicotinamidase-related amidase